MTIKLNKVDDRFRFKLREYIELSNIDSDKTLYVNSEAMELLESIIHTKYQTILHLGKDELRKYGGNPTRLWGTDVIGASYKTPEDASYLMYLGYDINNSERIMII